MTNLRVLITWFEPFGGDEENASREGARVLLERWDDPLIELVGVQLPVEFDARALHTAVRTQAPDVLLCVGEAGRRRAITPERRAGNVMSARIADNAGRQPRDEAIVDDGARWRASPQDAEAVVRTLREQGWAAEVSDDAGGYVCNFIAYHAYGCGIPALFLHVPALRRAGIAGVGRETDDDAPPVGGMPAVASFDDLGAALAVVVKELAAQVRAIRHPAASSRRRGPSTTR